MLLKSAILASIPALGALAAPTGSSGQNPDPAACLPATYGLMVGTDVQPFHFETFNANSGKFWVNLPETETSCPFAGTPNSNACPPGTYTAFSGNGGMAATVPGGQAAYIASSGALMFTQAHANVLPDGAVGEPFIYTPPVDAEFGTVSTDAFGADGFMACPTYGSIAFQVFANFPEAQVPLGNVDDCVAISPLAVPYTLGEYAAWQYN